MKSQLSNGVLPMLFCVVIFFSQCDEKKSSVHQMSLQNLPVKNAEFNGFKSQIDWGEHLVIIGACHDCHTPKKLTSRGPVLDTALWLSGHPASMPLIDIDRKEIESKGLAVAMDLTEWVGPWGVSFSANLTPDPTGIGSWTEEQFMYCIREGKLKGVAGSRTLLPPMPWDMVRQMTDDELKAVFAYLKSIKPVNNLVPAPLPPLSMVN